VKVLITDSLDARAVALLQEEGPDGGIQAGMSPGESCRAIAEFDALVVRSGTRVTPEIIGAAAAMKVIGRADGVDNIDVESASRRDHRHEHSLPGEHDLDG